MKNIGDYVATLILAAAIADMGACGSSGGGGKTSCSAGSTCVQVAGTWTTIENVSASACGPAHTDNGQYTVAQTGCTIVVTPAAGGGPFNGGVNGSQICWSGSYPDSGGTTTITSLTLTVGQSGTSFNGTANWSWTDGSTSCSGTTQITGTKI